MKCPLIHYKALLTAICLMSLVSCRKELLDPVPRTTLPDQLAFSTPERILQQVHGMYISVKDGRFLGGRGLVYNDVRTEEWLNVTTNAVTAFQTWNHSLTSTTEEVKNFWSFGYTAINDINVVLKGIADNPTVLSQAAATRYQAEGRFLRAVSYFYLVTLYGKKPYTFDNGASAGLPLRLTAVKTLEDVNTTSNLARSPVADVYKQILEDLNYAETNLPLSYGTANDTNIVRAHRNAAIAFKTRVYLNMGRYADLITEANKIVSNTAPFQASAGRTHRLEPNFAAIFRTPYTSAESVFSLPMTNTSGPGTQNGIALYHNTEYELNPVGILGDPGWMAGDSRRSFVVTVGVRRRYNKFNSDNENYVPVIRYGEVLLNLAEALVRVSNTMDLRALSLLNAVRQRADPGLSFTAAGLGNTSGLLNAILTERRIELLGEGLRSMDILRQLLPIPAKGTVAAIPPDSRAYVWPISQDELLYNKMMTTNE